LLIGIADVGPGLKKETSDAADEGQGSKSESEATADAQRTIQRREARRIVSKTSSINEETVIGPFLTFAVSSNARQGRLRFHR
jgi:hypothetical protein